MILTFQKRFVQPILNGTKFHTIRADKHNRWNIGMKIQFWCGNPRNPSKQPYQFAEGIVKEIMPIWIYPERDGININYIYILRDINELNSFARRDGFRDWEDMKTFFPDNFEGKLIIWEQPIKEEK